MIVDAPRPPTEASRVSFSRPSLSPECSCARPRPTAFSRPWCLPSSPRARSNEGGSKSGASGADRRHPHLRGARRPRRPSFRRSSPSRSAADRRPGLRPPRGHLERADDDRRQDFYAAARQELDVGARLAVDRVFVRPARPLARRQAGNRRATSATASRSFTDPKVGLAGRGDCSRNVDSVSVRDSLTAVVWFKKHTPEQFYDVAYQLFIVPEHVYGAIPVEQSAHVRRRAHSDRERPVSVRPVGTGREVRARSPTRRIIADARSSIA